MQDISSEKTQVILNSKSQTWSGEEISRKILPSILDIGCSLMTSGADVNHVERLLTQLGYAYNAKEMNVFVITGCIIVTMTISDGREYTQTRRIGPAEFDFYKLELLNKLCRSCRHVPLPPTELQARLKDINSEKKLKSWSYVGSVLVVTAYTAFFGGTVAETAVSAILAIILCFLVQKLSQKTPNLIGFNFVASFFIGIVIAFCCKNVSFLTADSMTSGVIMTIIPGLALTNSIRDMLSGDTLAGLMRFCESLLWTAAMVFGFMVAFSVLGLTVHTNIPVASWELKLVMVIPATLGLLLCNNSRRALMIFGLVGSLLTFIAYIYCEQTFHNNEFLCVCLASFVAAIFSEVVAKKKHVPTAVFFFAAVMPMIPGRLLFSTVNNLAQAQWDAAASTGHTVAMTVLGISTAICVVWTISRTWQNFHVNERIEKMIHSSEGAK